MTSLEIAKKMLGKYQPTQGIITYRGVAVSEFTKEELLKLIDMFSYQIEKKHETIHLLANLPGRFHL